MPAGNPAPSRAHRELPLPLRRHKDRPRFGRLHDCGLGELVCDDYLSLRETELALKTCDRALDLLPNDVGALAIKASIYHSRGDLDRSRIVTREPHIRPCCWRDARSDSDRAGRKPDARTARAPVAAAHEPTSAAGSRPSPSTRLTRGV